MTIQEILNQTAHRPWALPTGRWRYYQEWNKAIFLHWKVDSDELRKFVPEEMSIDVFEGQAWVSLVAFSMEKIRPRNLPHFSPVSNFIEINVRTYASYKQKPGVYFLSIEGGRRISCQLAKSLSQLPYRYSEMKKANNFYCSEHLQFGDKLEVNYTVGEKVENKTSIDYWLTERYALFQESPGFISEFETHHIEWPIYEAQIDKLELEYPRFGEMLNKQPDLVHYSPGVKVIAWDKKRHKR